MDPQKGNGESEGVQHRTPTMGEETGKTEDQVVVIDSSKIKLKKEIGLLSGVSFVVGSIIGSGIFITPQGVLRNTGSVGLCMTVWTLGAVLSMLGALTFTELISVVRKSGSQYSIFMKALGSAPAFLYAWSNGIASLPASRAVQCLTFAEYLSSFLELCGSPVLPKKLVAITILLLLMITNSYSVRLTAMIQIVFTTAKLTALVIIIIGGLVRISQGTVSELPTGFEGSIIAPSNIALAFYSVMFSYDAWNNCNFIVEELKNPRRNAPLASMLGVAIVAVVYILTNVSYLAVMTKQELLASSAVALTWGDRVLGSVSWLIPLAVMMSVFGSANGGISTTSRIQFAAARDGNWWGFLSFIHVTRYTPMPSIIFQVSLAMLMVIQGSITTLINFLSFSLWFFYFLSALCCLILRFKIKNDPQRIKIPIVIPILFMLWCMFLVIAPVVQNPRIELLYATIFVLAGLVLYIPLVYFKLKLKGLDTLEMYLQLLLQVAPGTYDLDYS